MTTRGKNVLTILLLGVVGFGVWKVADKLEPKALSNPTGRHERSFSAREPNPRSFQRRYDDAPSTPEVVETLTGNTQAAQAAAYQPKDNTVEVELSEYAGYAGFIVANGGLSPNENPRLLQEIWIQGGHPD